MHPSPSRLLAAATLVAVLACAVALATQVGAAPVPDTTILVDRPSGTGALPYDGAGERRPLAGALTSRGLSADGRYVAFASTADDLLGDDDDAGTHVYRLDRQTGAILQADVGPGGAQTGSRAVSDEATISSDGRFVAFRSTAPNLAPVALGGGIFVKDLQTGALDLVSRDAAGTPLVGVQAGVLSGDGRHVAFAVNGGDVYLRSLGAGASLKDIGGAAVAPGAAAIDVAFDGRAVAFVSSARLTTADTDAERDVYAWRAIGGPVLVSRTGLEPGTQVAISGDGLKTAWLAGATSIVMADTATGPPVNVSVGQAGKDNGGFLPAFERTGSAAPATRLDFIGFDLVAADHNGQGDLYGADVATAGDPSQLHLLTAATEHVAVGPAASVGDGSVAVFASGTAALPGGDGWTTQLYRATPGGGVRISLPPGGTARVGEAGDATLMATHALSDDGSLVAFSSAAPALGAISPGADPYDQPLGAAQGLLRDVPGATTTVLGLRPDGTPAAGEVEQVTVDATGRHVAFLAGGALIPALAPAVTHAHVRDLASGTNVVLDRQADGRLATTPARDVVIAADGRHAVFTSADRKLPEAPDDGNWHAYLADVETGTIRLVDRGPDGKPGNGHVVAVDVSGDGTRVAFSSNATNLGAGDGGTNHQVYVRDLAAGTTTWASAPEDRDPRHADALNPSLDRAGDTVAYAQVRPDFGHGTDPDVPYGAFVTEVATGATELAGAGAPEAPSLSADGTRVAFVASRVEGRDAYQAFVRDRVAGTTTPVLPGGGAARGIVQVSLSGDGRCVALQSDSAGLAGGYGPDFTHVFERCVGAPPAGGGPGPGGGGAPPSGGPGVPPRDRDRTAPKVTKAKLTRTRFAVAKGRTATKAAAARAARAAARAKAAARGTAFAFRLSERATITIKIVRRAGAKKVVTLTRAKVRAGNVKVNYSGRTKATVLKPGAYRAELTATDAAGNRSKVTRLAFTVVRR